MLLIAAISSVNNIRKVSREEGGSLPFFDAADKNKDGIVTLGEITDYLRSSVSEMIGGKQNPQVSRTAFDRNLPLSVLR